MYFCKGIKQKHLSFFTREKEKKKIRTKEHTRAEQTSNGDSKKSSCFCSYILMYELNCDRNWNLNLSPLREVLFVGLL